MTQPWANPLARTDLSSRRDMQVAVIDLYEPLLPYLTEQGAQAQLASFGAVFEQRVAGLEGFARPLYGIVPLTVGGGSFPHWDRLVSGLDAGTDPSSSEYWGEVCADTDQRMVEQAAIGLALAFCPEHIWEPLSEKAKQRLVTWLNGIYAFEPAANNWQFFRVLVSLGLERVGRPVDTAKTEASIALLKTYERGECWYVDGGLNNVDYYTPFAMHTYGLMYAAATELGLGDPTLGAHYRRRAKLFANDFVHWFDGDGAAIAMGRSLTYRFAMASFWGALAWANVEPSMGWGAARGMAGRHLRWWQDKAISDRDGVLSVGYTYDNRRLCESYNSGCSPYWSMKAFAGLAAPANHPFWTAEEAPQPEAQGPVTLIDAGWVVARSKSASLAIVAQPAPDVSFPEEGDAKYRKFAYSSAFGFCGDLPDATGSVWTDSMLALTDEGGMRKVRRAIEAAGVVDGLAWSTWYPWPDVRIDTLCWAIDSATHGRIHRVRNGRTLHSAESGFAVGYEPVGMRRRSPPGEGGDNGVDLVVGNATSSLWCLRGSDLDGVDRRGVVRSIATNGCLTEPHAAVPVLLATLDPGEHLLSVGCFASATARRSGRPRLEVRPDVVALFDSISSMTHERFDV